MNDPLASRPLAADAVTPVAAPGATTCCASILAGGAAAHQGSHARAAGSHPAFSALLSSVTARRAGARPNHAVA